MPLWEPKVKPLLDKIEAEQQKIDRLDWWSKFKSNFGRAFGGQPIQATDPYSRRLQESAGGIMERNPWMGQVTEAAQTPGFELSSPAMFGGIKNVGKGIPKKAARPAAEAVTQVTAEPLSAIEKLKQSLPFAKALQGEFKGARSVQLSGKVGKAAKILEEGGGTPEAFAKSKAALAGESPLISSKIPENLRLTPEDITGFHQTIAKAPLDYFTRIHAQEGLAELLTTGKIQPARAESLEAAIPGLVDSIDALTKTLGEKAWAQIIDALNIPRSVMTSGDFSAFLRQGGFMVGGHPVIGAKTMAKTFKMAFSEKYMMELESIQRARPGYIAGKESGLYHAPIPITGKSPGLAAKEEMFMSNLVNKIPILGSVVKGSNRAFVGFLNEMRSRVWEDAYQQMVKVGAKESDFSQMAKLINASSGRANVQDIPGIGKSLSMAGPFLNGIFFAPRWTLSRLELPKYLFSTSKATRIEAWREIGATVGLGTSLLSMMELSGIGHVELDPRSSDFGKLRIGNTRYDIWTGYSQWMRFMAQIATAQRKTTVTGGMAPANRLDTLVRFMQSKTSPFTGFILDLLAGKTYSGEELKADWPTVWEQAYRRIAPLTLQDMIDAQIIPDGGGFLGGFPSAFGVGVQTYEPSMKPTKLPEYSPGGSPSRGKLPAYKP